MSRWNFERAPQLGEVSQSFVIPRQRRKLVGELVVRDGETIRVLPPSKAGRVSIDNVRGAASELLLRGDVGTSSVRKHPSDMNRP